MNGIHDMGGMHGIGPLEYEKNQPVYHSEWEGRVDAMYVAMWATGKISRTSSSHRGRNPRVRIHADELLRTMAHSIDRTDDRGKTDNASRNRERSASRAKRKLSSPRLRD